MTKVTKIMLESFHKIPEKQEKFQLSTEAFSSILENEKNQFVFIKNEQSIYQFSNRNFSDLMGLKNPENIINKMDKDLYHNISMIKQYLHDDQQTLEEEKIFDLSGDVSPKSRKISQHLSGKLYPLYCAGKSRPAGILGVFTTTFRPFRLELETLLGVDSTELSSWLIKPSYTVTLNQLTIRLSRREIHCLAALLKGQHAGEIAQSLSLKQTTIESYLVNLKNKLGATSRSHLIQIVLGHHILQQVIL